MGGSVRHLHDTWICSAALLCALLSARASAADSWSYEASPFLWAAGIDGREGPSSLAPDVHADFKDLVDFVDVGAALRLVARRPPVGWFAEASYVSLKDDISLPTGGTLSVRSTDTFAEGGLLYELNSAFAVYGGVRYQGIETKIALPARQSRDTEDWIDAMIGARWTPLVSDHWVLWARGDVGGGSSNLVWLAEAGGGYRWGERWGVYAAYRMLDTDYENGGFVYDIRQSGLLFGFGFRF
jgi:hypothetical protein